MFIETENGDFIDINFISYFQFDHEKPASEEKFDDETIPCQVFLRCYDDSLHYLGVYTSEVQAKKTIFRMLFKHGKIIPFSELEED
jgi:hypothetical protein